MTNEDAMMVHVAYIREILGRMEVEMRETKTQLACLEKKVPNNLEPRLRDLEAWKSRVIGVAAAAGAVAALLFRPLWDWLRGSK